MNNLTEVIESHNEWLDSGGKKGEKANLRWANLIGADLRRADLSGANLRRADLRRADLSGANLSGANLSGANLSGADLIGSNQSGADLSGADLSGANLSGANLIGANLSGADLRRANLIGANLRGANLRWANLSGADLRGADLRGAEGIGSREAEVHFAKKLLETITSGEGSLDMSKWHACDTVHCIAGWMYPGLDRPGSAASRALPTLARYFFASEEDALAALERVASGEESVFGAKNGKRLISGGWK